MFLTWTPHPVVVTIRDNSNYIAPFYSYDITITGWGFAYDISVSTDSSRVF